MFTADRIDLNPKQVEDLRVIFGARFTTNESVLVQNSRDEPAFPPVLPSAVIYPHNTGEVSKVLAYCNQNLIPVVAFGAGLSLEGQVLPLKGGTNLDMTEMN